MGDDSFTDVPLSNGFLDKIPNYSIIHEAVEIAKKHGHRGVVSFVNGILREIDRNGIPFVQKIKDPIERLSIDTSQPKWLIKRWMDHYGYEVAEAIGHTFLEQPKYTIRI